MITPDTIAFRVFMGASTAARYAREFGITKTHAHRALAKAYRHGMIVRVARGEYAFVPKI